MRQFRNGKPAIATRNNFQVTDILLTLQCGIKYQLKNNK
jgi:hypothetical protein